MSGENTFIQMYPYLGDVVVDKEKLMRKFRDFLDDPESSDGIFMVYWEGNEEYENRYTPKEYINKYLSRSERSSV